MEVVEPTTPPPPPTHQHHHHLTVQETLDMIQAQDVTSRIRAAQEIRRMTKTSHRCRRQLSNSIKPLVAMLRINSIEANEAALLALLNLAVKDDQNKMVIVEAGALEPITKFLQSPNQTLQEYACASLLTLSASSTNKSTIITAYGTVIIPLLVEALSNGTLQAKVDSIMALANLSTHSNTITLILAAKPIPSIINLLISCKKSSRTAEKCTSLVESLINFEDGRQALVSEEGGVLAIVEMLESGSPQSREHAVGTLLMMCESDRSKYREPILSEGVIPGLLELTVQGTPKAQTKAQTLLRLLRDSTYDSTRPDHLEPDTLENIVCNIISRIEIDRINDGEDEPGGKAKKMLAKMVQVSMEQSWKHLQKRASMVCDDPSPDLSIANCGSK